MYDEIRIYVADLAAYNNGFLHGAWIDATQDIGIIKKEIREMLDKTPLNEEAEEYAIHDFEGFGSYRLSEYEGIDRAHEIACFISDNGEIAGDLLNYFSGEVKDATKAIEDNYCGCYTSIADYARDIWDVEIPDNLQFYIDNDLIGRDIEMSGDIFSIEKSHDELHIFSNF